jgi:hypothetical protein
VRRPTRRVTRHGATRRALVGASLVAALGVGASAVQPQVRQWCVTVMDDDHQPVAGLGSEDFSLKDGGARQPVVASEPAVGPWSVAVAVVGGAADTSQAIGRAVDRFVRTIQTSSPGSRVHLVVDRPVSDPAVASLITAARVVPGDVVDAGSRAWGAVLAASVREVPDEGPAVRRAVVAILPSAAPDGAGASDLLGLLERTHISLWTVEVAAPHAAGAMPARAPGDDLLDAAVTLGGGLRWRVDATGGLPVGAQAVGCHATRSGHRARPTLVAVGPSAATVSQLEACGSDQQQGRGARADSWRAARARSCP